MAEAEGAAAAEEEAPEGAAETLEAEGVAEPEGAADLEAPSADLEAPSADLEASAAWVEAEATTSEAEADSAEAAPASAEAEGEADASGVAEGEASPAGEAEAEGWAEAEPSEESPSVVTPSLPHICLLMPTYCWTVLPKSGFFSWTQTPHLSACWRSSEVHCSMQPTVSVRQPRAQSAMGLHSSSQFLSQSWRGIRMLEADAEAAKSQRQLLLTFSKSREEAVEDLPKAAVKRTAEVRIAM